MITLAHKPCYLVHPPRIPTSPTFNVGYCTNFYLPFDTWHLSRFYEEVIISSLLYAKKRSRMRNGRRAPVSKVYAAADDAFLFLNERATLAELHIIRVLASIEITVKLCDLYLEAHLVATYMYIYATKSVPEGNDVRCSTISKVKQNSHRTAREYSSKT